MPITTSSPSNRKEKYVKTETERERKNIRKERENARRTTIKQDDSRTFRTMLQLSTSLPSDLYIYGGVSVSDSYI